MRYTFLKGWPARTQVVFIGGLISVLAVLTVAAGAFLVAAWWERRASSARVSE